MLRINIPLKRGLWKGLYYINAYGMEVRPSPNGDFLANLDTKDILVYSCGSLWTRSVAFLDPTSRLSCSFLSPSIIPCLALRGVAGKIAKSPSLRAKVLLRKSTLNTAYLSY